MDPNASPPPQGPPNKLRRLESEQTSPHITSYKSSLLPDTNIRVAASSPQVDKSPVAVKAEPANVVEAKEEIEDLAAALPPPKEEVVKTEPEAAANDPTINTELRAGGGGGGEAATEAAQAAGEDERENISVETRVQLSLMEAVEQLSTVARCLERWQPFRPSIGVSEEQRMRERKRYDEVSQKSKARVAEHIKKFLRKSRKLIEMVDGSNAFDSANIPVDLIAHVDHYLSPNSWLRALYEEIEYINAIARGELEALGAFHSTLRVYIALIDHLHNKNLMKIPKFEEATLPPTALRSPMYRKEVQVDLMQVLGIVRAPLAPVGLGNDLALRKRRLL